MTRDFEKVGSMPFQADKVDAALSSIDEVLSALRAPRAASGGLPLPPARLTRADRLMAEPSAA